MELDELNRSVIEEFRANSGKVSGRFEDMPLLLITTPGARTGKIRTKPLVYIRDGNRYVVIASFAGAKNNPPWFHNLIANPEFDLEVGSEKFRARATVLAEPERTNLFNKMVEKMPIFAEYQAKTERIIPVLALEKV